MDKIWHSPEDHDTKNCIRSNEEILAELRRENFRLRLMLYNYEQVYHRSNNSDDPESPRIYAAECENVILRKLIDEKQLLLKEASKIIDTLKKENSRLEGIINDIQNKNEKAEIDWRNKYDDLYSELQQSREEIQSRDMKILSKDAELNRKRNDLESYISELQNRLEISESLNCQYKREIRLFQTEADSLRTTLENVNQEQSSFKITDLATDPIRSIDIHDLCKEHFNELSNMIHVLSKQITDVEFGESHPASHGPSDSVIRDLSHMMTELPNLHNNEATSDLTDRLHSARLLILELVNEKLRLDKLLATISSSHERALAVLKEKCCTVESQMSMQAQFHDEELSRRDSEIKRLNEHINIIIKQLENSLLTRDKVQSELSIVREQLERSKCDQSKLQEQLLLELRGKENTTYRFDNSMLPWTNALDSVAQFSSLNIFSHEELLSMKSLVTGFNGENKYELQNQPDLSVSLSEDQAKTYSIVSDIENCKIRDRTDGTNEVKMVNNQVALPNDIGELQKELTLVRKQLRDQIQAMSRLKMEYDLLAGNTHLGSLISDNVTSVTKDISVNSRTSSAIGSVGDLPTVSTPPGNLGSPVFPEILGSITQDNANNLLNTCDLTNPNNSASSHIENSMPVVLNRENEITDRNHSSVYPKLTISDVFNHITVIPEEQEVVNEQDNKENRSNQFTPENSISIGVSNEPNSLYRLRNLYDLVHDLKLKLDNVRFTQHSFVEMINHSLSTAGIDTSLRVPFTPNEVEDSVRHSLSVVCDDKSFEESGRMLSDHAKMSRLRDAIDECSDVSSAFWDVDIKKNLSALLTSHLESNHSVDGRNSARRPINVGNMVIDTTRSNNSSHQLTNVSDAAAAAAPDYDSIDFFGQNTDEVKSSQLYGPVWLQPENNNDQTNVYWRQLENELTRVNHERDQLTLKLQEVTDKLIRVQEDNSYLEHEFKSLHCSSSLPLTDVNDEYPPTDILLKNNHLETVDKAIQLETNLIICENDASHQYKKLKDELHKRDETIHRLELDRLYIMKKLSLLNSDDTCCTNMIELIDTVVTEMSTSRTLIRDLKHHISEFERRLDDCIPTGEYYQLKEQVDSLRLELNQVYSQVDHYKSTLEFVSTTLEPLLCIEKSLPFNELIDNIVDKFQRQDALINSLSTERDIAFNTIKSYITASVQPIPNSLIKCIEIIGNDSSHFHSLVNNLELDRQQAMDLIKKMAPVEKNLHTISDYVNWFIHLFNKTQNKLNDMEQLYEETKNSLSVSIEKFEKFELIIKSLDKKLNTCQYRLKCCQSELVQVTETCIPLEVHNNILKNLQTVEKLCSEFQSKNLEYEQKLQTIIGIIGSTLSKTIEPNNLKDDVMEICSSLTSYRNASNSADQRCKEWEVKFEN
ncbi:unnamed protein product [Heterobilharzia americana]|nr:unnamed protein product [Heterobilharzia americana]